MSKNRDEKMLVQFEDNEIRRVWDEKEQKWYFSVSDIVGALSDSKDPKSYWRQLKRREPQLVTICHGFKLVAADGKRRLEDCTDTEGVLRIIQSIPSPKAEPFKQWLATVGRERLEELDNPELIAQRFRETYQQKGYSNEWIEARLRSVDIRKELTDEWHERGVKEGKEYAFLTAEISRGAFGISPSEHKEYKDLQKKHNLRDHMSNAELVFTMLGELSTTQIARSDDAQGFVENEKAAKEGGAIAGNARRQLEDKTGKPVLSNQNYLERPESEQLSPGNSNDDETSLIS
jgi:DNA-damage-inducible protein D